MLKSNIVGAIIGLALVSAFLGTMVWWLKSVPLTIIVLGVVALMIVDIVKSLREINDAPGG